MSTDGPVRVNDPPVDPPERPSRGRRLRDRSLGVIVGLLIATVGAAVLLASPPSYSAAATLVVLPSTSLTGDEVASYYDTLSQGQVVGTFAEVLRARVVEGPIDDPEVTVLVVPDTSVIRLVATGETARQAEGAAEQALAAAADPLDGLAAPYRVSVVSGAEGRAKREGRPVPLLVGVVTMAAVGAGLLAHRGERELDRLRTRDAPSERRVRRARTPSRASDRPPQ